MSRSIELSVGEYYHLYNRGVEKRKIFLDKKDYQRFVVLMYLSNTTDFIHLSDHRNFSFAEFFALKRKDTLTDIGAYCLMPNHFHILIKERKERGISTFMQKLMTGYSMYFNKKYERRGTLFEGPFKAKHADSDEYLKYLFAYIHLNPAKLINGGWRKSGIVDIKKTESYLHGFTHSSYADYLRDVRPQSVVLNMSAFPDYFENIRGVKKLMKEWLDFSNPLPNVKARP